LDYPTPTCVDAASATPTLPRLGLTVEEQEKGDPVIVRRKDIECFLSFSYMTRYRINFVNENFLTDEDGNFHFE
jgi:hypothetical protein